MKFVKKSDLQFEDGYLIDEEGNVHMPERSVVEAYNELETMVQRSAYLAVQKEVYVAADVTGENFERASALGLTAPRFHIDTPVLDEEIAQAERLMRDIERANLGDKCNAWGEEHAALYSFVKGERFIETEEAVPPFDGPCLGNPLELTVDVLARTIVCAFTDEDTGVTPHDHAMTEDEDDKEE